MRLFICEKPDQAKSVAEALGGMKKDRMSWVGPNDIVVSARGHLLTLAEPQELMPHISWNDPATLKPVPSNFSMKVIPPTKGFKGAQPSDYLKNIGFQLKKAKEVVIATDSDREGEAIGWSILEHFKYKGAVKRAWFSGGTDKESYKKALNNLYEPERTKGWARASQARGRSDWYYQLLVRAYTFYGQRNALGSNLGRGNEPRERVVSVGRVQLPVVKMVFDRDQEIANFKSVDHFRVFADFQPVGMNAVINAAYSPVVTKEVIEQGIEGVHWEPSKTVVEEGKEAPLDRPLFVDKNTVEAFMERVKGSSSTVTNFASRNKEKHPPKAHALMGAQKEIGKKYPNLSAEQLQAIVEDLYEQGWISYPRTEHEEIPLSFYEPEERNAILENLLNLEELKPMAQMALDVHNGNHSEYKAFVPKGFSKKEMEHHGLLPTKQPIGKGSLLSIQAQKKGNNVSPETMQFAYIAIVKRFVQMMLPAATIAEQKVEFSVPVKDLLGADQSIFKTKSEQVVKAGWLQFASKEEKLQEAINLSKGTAADVVETSLYASQTKPPAPYTEIGLGEAMSNVGRMISDPKLRALIRNASGLGTPATRSTVIATVKDRGYLNTKGKNIHCTQKGADLLQVVPENMTSPEMTAIWEDRLIEIQNEKDDSVAEKKRDLFVGKQREIIEKLLGSLEANYRHKCSDKPIQSSGSRSGGKPTAGMVKFAKQIIENSKGKLKAPRGMTTDFEVCKKFLDANANQTSGEKSDKPSEKQLQFAEKIWAKLSQETKQKINKDEAFATRKGISEFIDNHMTR